ncbi:Copine-8 [Porphyridium purpureum]|uniref:Copine-8 n=1 Tax=Porphyridium purpureum TaxID=35688 RepID=A0A5J4Z179_PORPP|nr:Copine-8 [Porphyridium purpureum]|eukprot:POR5550..scf295_1
MLGKSQGVNKKNNVFQKFGTALGSRKALAWAIGDMDGRLSCAVSREYRATLEELKNARESGSELIEVSFACVNLPKMDLTSDSDPFAVVWLADGTQKEVELMRTETVWDDQDPFFVQALLLCEDKIKTATLRVCLYDRDDASERLEKHDYMGNAVFPVTELLSFSSLPEGLQLPLQGKKSNIDSASSNAPTVIIHCCRNMNIASFKQVVEFYFSIPANRSSGDRFFTLSRQQENGSWATVYRSEVVLAKNNQGGFFFQCAQVCAMALNNGNPDWKNRFELCNYQATGWHETRGTFVFTVRELEMLSTTQDIERVFLGSEEDEVKCSVLSGGILSDDKMSFTFDIMLR